MSRFQIISGLCLAAIIVMAVPGLTAVASNELLWSAGTARVEITPTEPLWLAGYAARNRPAEATIHPLYAKALALRDAAGNRAVIITCDILGFPKPFATRIRNRMMADHGLETAQIILSASHTHSAPVIDNSLKCIYAFDAAEEEKLEQYARTLENQIVMLAGEAFAAMKPAMLHAGNGIARFAVNRRNNAERELTATTTLQGPIDHAVPTLSVVREDGTLAALLFGYACHATTLDGYAWCGDYPGFAQIALESAFPGTTALFFAGCGADQNPLPRRSAALARQYGNTLAEAVKQALEDSMQPLEAQLSTAYAEIELELEAAPDADALHAQLAASSGYEHACTQALLDSVEQGHSLPNAYPYPVQVWQLGRQRLVALGGEVTVAYAVALKERLGQETFVMGYANDLMAYIPSEIILQEGRYEGKTSQLIYGMPNVWKSGIETHILDTAAAMASSLSTP